MIHLNTHTGIMEMHNKKRIRPPREELPCDKRQWTDEEKQRWETYKPPDRTKKFNTTAPQRPIPTVKPKIDIWEDKP